MFNRTRGIATLLVVAASASFAATADASVNVAVTPRNPIVDDSISVKWKTDRVLKPGWNWRVTVLGAPGSDCAGYTVTDSNRRPGKGKPMNVFVSTGDDRLNQYADWCQGKALINVSITNGKSNVILGFDEARFSGKP